MDKEEFAQVKEQVQSGRNPSGYKPVEYKVVILNEHVEETFDGGIIEKSPRDVEKDRMQQTEGYVAAISEMAFTDGEGSRWKCEVPDVGDKVLFSKYAGQLYGPYRIVNDKDIVAIVKE